MDCSSKGVNGRLEKEWSALDTIWKLEFSGGLKIGFFRPTVEKVLSYGSTA